MVSWFAWPQSRILSSPENFSVATVFYLCCFIDTAGFISLGNLFILVFPAKSSFPIFRLYHFIIMICGKYCLTHHDTMITMLRWSFGLMPKLNMSFWKQSKLLLRSFHAHDPDISSHMLYWCISLVIIYAYVSETLTTFSNFHQSLFWKGSVTPLYPRQSCSANESWFKRSCDWQNSNFIVGRSFSML